MKVESDMNMVKPVDRVKNYLKNQKENEKAPESAKDRTKINREQIMKTIDAAYNPKYHTSEFTQDEATGEMIIKIYDKDSEELIREIPPEELLKMKMRMSQFSGTNIDEFI